MPTTVRTEAGWDRTLPEWSLANQVGVADVALSPVLANVAATIRFSGRVPLSVTNAHIGAVVQSSDASLVTVITSDPADVRAACGNVAAVIVTL